MPDLSACYFCGAAADATVCEYDVVPDAVDETLQSTATLCSGCRAKLETVLSTVARGAAPDDEPVDAELRAVDADTDTDLGGPAVDQDDEEGSINVNTDDLFGGKSSASETDSFDSAEGEETNAAGQTDAAGRADDDPMSFDAGAESSGAGTGTAESQSASQSNAGQSDPTSPSTETGQSGSAPDAGDGDASRPDDQAADAAATGSETGESVDAGPAGQSASAGGGSGTSGGAGGGAAGDVERPDTQTYNRVIRLLQNREFPLNRSEFSEVATSAYDVSPGECARVIDYAIQRGELREDRGMLKKP
jgi:hypothetical protein